MPLEASTDANVLDAASRGTRDGLQLALNIAAMLIAFLGLIALVNMGLVLIRRHVAPGDPGLGDGPGRVSAGRAMGGCPPGRPAARDAHRHQRADRVRRPGKNQGQILPRSFVIASFALCGFANISSIGIQLGGIGALAPERRHDLARLGVKALLAGTLANYLSACIAGILL